MEKLLHRFTNFSRLSSVSGFMMMLALMSGCAGPALQVDQDLIAVPSPNHDARRPNYIILHQTSNDSVNRALQTLTSPERKVSAHFLIDRTGRLYQLVDESRRAWHAGLSYWGGLTDLNSASIGIELDNTGDEPFADAQIERLLGLLKELTVRHTIPVTNVLGHGDIAPGRKVDPSRFFPWGRLAQEGFGLWCHPSDARPAVADSMLALQAIGYDIAQVASARAAFRRHYFGSDEDIDFTSEEKQWLGCLVEKRRMRINAGDSQ